jgi:magnesium-transporting ATPase (P-type)
MLKSETPAVINDLINVGLNLKMITGDNPLTSIHVGRECGLIKGSEILLIEKSVKKNGVYTVSKINKISLEIFDELALNEENINEIAIKIKEKFGSPAFTLNC